MKAVERPDLKLEGALERGKVPGAVVQELARLKDAARVASKDFGTAIEEQAKKYGCKKAALRRYVTAVAADKVHELQAETDSLEKLLGLE